jgi:hypothetical protein
VAFSPEELRAAVLAKLKDETTHSEPANERVSVPIKAESSGIGLGPYAALLGGEAADIGTTLAAKSRGGKESNPLLGDFGPGAIAGKAGTALAMTLLMRYLAGHGHPTLAKSLGYGSGAGLGAVAAHNATVK